MKDVVSKKLKENRRKAFTKKRENITIDKNYNPLKVNSRLIYKRREGLYKMEKEILEEIEKDLNFKERIIVHINKKTFIKVFNLARIDTINKLIK